MPLNKKVKVLLYGGFLWFLGEGMLGPLFAVFSESVGGDVLDITWAWAVYLIFGGILYVLFGKISDEFKNKELLMVVGYAVNAIFTFGYLFVSEPWHLLIVQAGLGVATAMATPTWDALYAKHTDKRHDGYLWGLGEGMNQIITGVAILIGGYILSYTSFTTLFLTMGIIQVIATIYQVKILWVK